MKKIEFVAVINAPKHHVWETMIAPATYEEWVAAAWPGSGYEGTWKEGEKIRFVGAEGSGTLAELIEFRPYDFILARHIAILLKGGKEDRDSEMAMGWIGTEESYTFKEKNNKTELTVWLTINPEWESMFSDGWPKALAKLKEISER